MYSISLRSYLFLLCVFLCSFATFVALTQGGTTPIEAETVDKIADNRIIEGNAVELPREPEDYRFIVTTTLVKVQRGGWVISNPFSRGANDVRLHLDTLAKEFPDAQVVVHGIFDLRQ